MLQIRNTQCIPIHSGLYLFECYFYTQQCVVYSSHAVPRRRRVDIRRRFLRRTLSRALRREENAPGVIRFINEHSHSDSVVVASSRPLSLSLPTPPHSIASRPGRVPTDSPGNTAPNKWASKLRSSKGRKRLTLDASDRLSRLNEYCASSAPVFSGIVKG